MEKESEGCIVVTGCMMHCRRPFWEALTVVLKSVKTISEDKLLALPEYNAVSMISKIYGADNRLKGLTPEERQERRSKEVKPHVDAFFEFVHGLDSSDPIFSGRMKEAIEYANNNETRLRRFLDDGRIPIDNGYAERHFKAYAVGRRNWLFCKTKRGGDALATIYTLVETAKENSANPMLYLEYLLETGEAYQSVTERSKLSDLMPWSKEYKAYAEKKTMDRINASIPKSDERPYYRPYVKKWPTAETE